MTLKTIFLAVILGSTAAAPYWAQDRETTTTVLTEAGITPTKVGTDKYTEFPFFRGGLDIFVTPFEGTTKDGKAVKGTVSHTPVIGHPSIYISFKP